MRKFLGTENPADLMTKVLSLSEVVDRLGWMNLRAEINEGGIGG